MGQPGLRGPYRVGCLRDGEQSDHVSSQSGCTYPPDDLAVERRGTPPLTAPRVLRMVQEATDALLHRKRQPEMWEVCCSASMMMMNTMVWSLRAASLVRSEVEPCIRIAGRKLETEVKAYTNPSWTGPTAVLDPE